MLNAIKRKASAKMLGISDKQMIEMEAMQKEISAIEYRHEEDGIVVKMSGDMKIVFLEINGESREDVKKVINKTHDKLQQELARKMMSMGGGLGGMLGKM